MGVLFGSGDNEERSAERAAVDQPDGVYEGVSVIGFRTLDTVTMNLNS